MQLAQALSLRNIIPASCLHQCRRHSNAAAAGWGNAGGGATQALMPLLLGAIVMFGVEQTMGWRVALIVPGVMMVIVGVLYWKLTQDCPQGNFKEVRAQGIEVGSGKRVAWQS